MQEGMDGDLERERKRKYLAYSYQREYRQKAKAAKQKKEEERIKNLMRVRYVVIVRKGSQYFTYICLS